MSDLFFIIAGIILGWLLRWLWEAVEHDDAKLAHTTFVNRESPLRLIGGEECESDWRDYGYDSRTGERSDR